MQTSFETNDTKDIFNKLKDANQVHHKIYPGETEDRQPVHTVYGGAHLFKSNTAVRVGKLAVASFEEYAPNSNAFAKALGLTCTKEISEKVYQRVAGKLQTEALEDFRIDFEDGFGNRPDIEEDETAVKAAKEVAKGMAENTLPPFIGIRIKTFSEELKARSIRTLDLFITTLVNETGGKLPGGFVVTLPKITSTTQISSLIDLFEILESKTNLESGALKMEFMVETPESILNTDGSCALLSFVEAARGRCLAAHFGTYDYTASMNITAQYQAMDHSACDFARSFMKVALAGTGTWISDGATNIMPVGPHKNPKNEAERQENTEIVHRAWALSYQHVRHSLFNAFYQGWDLHPAQFPIRYAALYCFFLESLEVTSTRLKNFIDSAAKATLSGDVFDDAATGQGLLNFFLRALNCGAIDHEDIKKTGLTLEEIQTRSFYKILEGRKKL